MTATTFTGGPDILRTLPTNWVNITHWRLDGAEPDHWHGPIIDETDHLIRIHVWGDWMVFEKQKCVIERSNEMAELTSHDSGASS